MKPDVSSFSTARYISHALRWSGPSISTPKYLAPFEGANTLGKTQSEWPLRRYQQHVSAYTSRNLAYQSDGANAFAGIAAELTEKSGMSGMLLGMPACAFDWAILWTPNGAVTRLLDFPSWAWAGWKGVIDMPQNTYSLYDQRWLRKGTWIDWCKVDEKGEIVRLWDPARDNLMVSKLAAEVVESHSTEAGEDDGEGVKSSSEGADKDDEACPTYGWPPESGPYGRNFHDDIASLLSRFAKPEIRVPRIEHVSVGLLYFSTPIVSFCNFEWDEKGTFENMSQILDTDNRVCGFVKRNGNEEASSTCSGIAHLLLLSAASYGVLSIARGYIDSFAPCYQQSSLVGPDDDLPEDPQSPDYLNIMLPCPSEESVKATRGLETEKMAVSENAGVGFLHMNAIQKAFGGACWQEVLVR